MAIAGPREAMLAEQGARYAAVGETADAMGMVEGMTVSGRVIRLKTKWTGPNDPAAARAWPGHGAIAGRRESPFR